jgi:hypothetical protein
MMIAVEAKDERRKMDSTNFESIWGKSRSSAGWSLLIQECVFQSFVGSFVGNLRGTDMTRWRSQVRALYRPFL